MCQIDHSAIIGGGKKKNLRMSLNLLCVHILPDLKLFLTEEVSHDNLKATRESKQNEVNDVSKKLEKKQKLNSNDFRCQMVKLCRLWLWIRTR